MKKAFDLLKRVCGAVEPFLRDVAVWGALLFFYLLVASEFRSYDLSWSLTDMQMSQLENAHGQAHWASGARGGRSPP